MPFDLKEIDLQQRLGLSAAPLDALRHGPSYQQPDMLTRPVADAMAEAFVREPSSEMDFAEFIPADPSFGQQWHLRNTTAGQFDLRVEDVWDDFDGTGVQVTAIDTSFDWDHPDLLANYSSTTDYDYVQGDFNPIYTPPASFSENHGTAILGIVGAVEGNGIGGVGIAFGAEMKGYRGYGLNGETYASEYFMDAAGLGDGVGGNTNGDIDGTDVITMSGGRGSSVFFTDPDMVNAVGDLATIHAQGRGGLGTLFVKSSGNSRAAANSTLREEGTAELYDSSLYAINVAALRQDGWVTDYSTPGANVLVSAFADDVNNFGAIFTTDVEGSNGYSSGDYTGGFNGTSAAAPQVAAVIALMLDANPNLGWRDVHKILAYSARHVGSDVGANANSGAPSGGGFEQATQTNGSTWFWNDANDWNGGGLHFSNDYGYGLVDAKAAVRLAETWVGSATSANDTSTFEDDVNTTSTFDNITRVYTINETQDIEVEYVSIDIAFVTNNLADVEVFLTSPGGTRVQMLADTGDTANFSGRWNFGTAAFRGETSAGNWTLRVRDDRSGDSLTVSDADLRTFGSAITTDDLFIFTNEYSDYAGVAGHGTAFNGGSGTDTINAAAVDSNMTIDLLTNSGTVDGVAITNSDIQRVYTGDGNDTIIGDGFSEYLNGGRGNDIVENGSATETLKGGAGNDTLRFDNAKSTTGDLLDGGAGNDRVLLQGNGTFDLSDINTLSNYEEIEFRFLAGETKTLILRDQVLSTLLIDGNFSGVDNIVINKTGDVDLSGWTFNADWVESGVNADSVTINGDATGSILTGSEVADNIFGNAGDDTINGGGGDDVLRGGAGTDTVNGDAGDDLVIVGGGDGYDDADGGAGTDTFDWSGAFGSTTVFNLSTGLFDADGNVRSVVNFENYNDNAGAGTITGSSANNVINGNGGNDTIDGAGGTDTLNGGDGNDILTGGSGNNDVMNGDAGDDVARLVFGWNTDDAFNGGAGTDTIDTTAITGLGSSGFTIDLQAGTLEQTAFPGGSGRMTLSSVENIEAGERIDNLFGSGDVNVINAGAGNDTVDARSGADIVNAGDGDDIVNDTDFLSFDDYDGGAGFDTLDYSGVTFAAGVNFDVTTSQVGGVNFLNSDTFSNIERLIGSQGNDIMISDGGSVELFGDDGDDTIFAGLGTPEVLDGGNGVDLLDVSSFNGTYVIDMITGATNYAGELFTNFENIIMGNGSNNVTGTNANNEMTGGSSRDIFTGLDGDDTLTGNGGNDLLAGGLGADILDGGVGTLDAALYNSASAAVELSLATGVGTGGEADGDTFLNIERVVGSNFDDSIEGNGVTNRLEGRGGDDKIFGLGGNDQMIGGVGADIIDGGSGTDTAFYNDSGSAVTIDLGAGTGAGGTAAGDQLISIERIVASGFNDTLIGGSGTDWFEGEDGDDMIGGGGGNDLLFGGLGGDMIDGGADRDNLYYTRSSAVNVNLQTNVNTGGEANGDVITNVENVVGSAFGDSIVGNGLINNLQGRDGNDIIGGGANDDILFGGSGSDTFLFEGGYDIDRVRDFQNGTDQFDVSDFGLTAAQVVSTAVTFGTSVLINFGGGDRLIIENTTLAEIDTTDFIV